MVKILLSRKLGELRMKQSDLARVTGIHNNTIGEWYHELNDRINLVHLDKICKALKCEPGDLLVLVPDDNSREVSNKSKKHSK